MYFAVTKKVDSKKITEIVLSVPLCMSEKESQRERLLIYMLTMMCI